MSKQQDRVYEVRINTTAGHGPQEVAQRAPSLRAAQPMVRHLVKQGYRVQVVRVH